MLPRLAPAACRVRPAPSARSYMFPQPDFAARQRVAPGVDLHAPGAAGKSLYVPGRNSGHDTTVIRTTDIGPRRCPFRGVRKLRFQAGAGTAGSGSHGLPARAALTASRAVRPWAVAESR